VALSDRIDPAAAQEREQDWPAPEKEPIDRALLVVAAVVVLGAIMRIVPFGLIGASAAVPPSVRAHIAPPMAAAFGQTFWWALGLLAVAFIGSLALPKRKPVLAGDEQPLPIPI
jgi:hypothetical protein